jgi:hypothetical protein
MDAFVVPALILVRIDAPELNPSIFNLMPKYVRHITVRPLVMVAHRCWKGEHARTAMSKPTDLHMSTCRW